MKSSHFSIEIRHFTFLNGIDILNLRSSIEGGRNASCHFSKIASGIACAHITRKQVSL